MFVLVGSGEYLPNMESVDRELIRRLGGAARVVCMPTAAGAEGSDRIHYWTNLGVEHFMRLGAQVDGVEVIDRKTANDPVMAEKIASANFIYLSGGKPDYLYRTLEGTASWSAIQSVLAAGGVLAGCSAGAMVMADKFYGFPGMHQGFNFLPRTTVLPHFDEINPSIIQSVRLILSHDLTLIGVEGYTALVVDGDRYDVLGNGGVTVWNHTGKKRYTQGPLPYWG